MPSNFQPTEVARVYHFIAFWFLHRHSRSMSQVRDIQINQTEGICCGKNVRWRQQPGWCKTPHRLVKTYRCCTSIACNRHFAYMHQALPPPLPPTPMGWVPYTGPIWDLPPPPPCGVVGVWHCPPPPLWCGGGVVWYVGYVWCVWSVWYGMFGKYGMFGMYGRYGMYAMSGWYCMDGRYGM